MTFAEKALARAAGRKESRAGEILIVRPAHLLTHDNTSAIIGKIARELDKYGLVSKELPVIVLDHVVPANDEKTAAGHKKVREFARRFELPHFFDLGEGICHQVVLERALALPGTVVVGSDSHTCSYGAVSCFGTGIDRTEAAALLLTGKTWLRVPESIKVELTGAFQPGVFAKDLVLTIIGQVGAEGANYLSVEFDGPAVAGLSIDERITIANMGVEMGAKAAVFPVDAAAEKFLRHAGVKKRAYQALWADPGAAYARKLSYDLSKIEPVLALPHSVDNVQPVTRHLGMKIDQCLLGTCTNGRLPDFEIAARILKGRKVHPGVRLLLLPASRTVLREAIRAGHVNALVEAGGVLLPPGCGPCLGAHQGCLAPAEKCLSASNRNFKGRMGCAAAEIVLGSPATVAAAALHGAVADPRKELAS